MSEYDTILNYCVSPKFKGIMWGVHCLNPDLQDYVAGSRDSEIPPTRRIYVKTAQILKHARINPKPA
jgi:hypothetical protein